MKVPSFSDKDESGSQHCDNSGDSADSGLDVPNMSDLPPAPIDISNVPVVMDDQETPYIGEIMALEQLLEEYNDEQFRSKIQGLIKRFHSIRKARGDGNCFYRSFIFLLFEEFIHDVDELSRFEETYSMIKNDIIGVLGLQEYVVKDFCIDVDDILTKIRTKEIADPEALIEAFSPPGIFDSVLYFFRLMTAYEIIRNADFYSVFLELEGDTLKEYCQREVQRMYVDTEAPHYVAITNLLKVRLNVIVLERTPGDLMETSNGEPDWKIVINVLWRPGHYDCIYPRPATTVEATPPPPPPPVAN